MGLASLVQVALQLLVVTVEFVDVVAEVLDFLLHVDAGVSRNKVVALQPCDFVPKHLLKLIPVGWRVLASVGRTAGAELVQFGT